MGDKLMKRVWVPHAGVISEKAEENSGQPFASVVRVVTRVDEGVVDLAHAFGSCDVDGNGVDKHIGWRVPVGEPPEEVDVVCEFS